MKYEISNGSTLLATVDSVKTYSVTGLTPSTSYTFGVTPNNGLRKSSTATVTFKTRGVQFIIPKQLTVGETINLRYEEYPLGIVPIGNEPSGMFGGGNSQNLSAKVISTENGSSVIEVDSNVIDVGGRNLYIDTLNFSNPSSWWGYGSWTKTTDTYKGLAVMQSRGDWNGLSQYIQVKKGDALTYSAYVKYTSGAGISTIYWALNQSTEDSYSTASANPGYNAVTITDSWQRVSGTTVATSDGYLRPRIERDAKNSNVLQICGIKLEQGDIATPYASFVDGDTFTAQPDGTYALFSEYKAIYY